MEIETAAKILAELGNQVRLKVVRLLVKAGRNGVPVGRIQAELAIPASTLSHHLNHLKAVGLIRQQREQTTLLCVMHYELLEGVISFLTNECCFGISAETAKTESTLFEFTQ